MSRPSLGTVTGYNTQLCATPLLSLSGTLTGLVDLRVPERLRGSL
jgi:hypothetical protein